MLRWVRRFVALFLSVLFVYLGITAAQVYQASRADQRAPTDAILVLGAAQYDGKPSPALQRRLEHALALYQSGVAPRIVLTGSKLGLNFLCSVYDTVVLSNLIYSQI